MTNVVKIYLEIYQKVNMNPLAIIREIEDSDPLKVMCDENILMFRFIEDHQVYITTSPWYLNGERIKITDALNLYQGNLEYQELLNNFLDNNFQEICISNGELIPIMETDIILEEYKNEIKKKVKH